MAVVFFGDYWHKNPLYYEDKKTNDKDFRRLNLLKDKFGVETYVVWESDYTENKERIFNEILNIIK